MSQITVKCNYHGDIRRFTVPQNATSFDEILTTAAGAFSVEKHLLRMRYQDHDGDTITVVSQEDLDESLNSAETTPRGCLVRLDVSLEDSLDFTSGGLSSESTSELGFELVALEDDPSSTISQPHSDPGMSEEPRDLELTPELDMVPVPAPAPAPPPSMEVQPRSSPGTFALMVHSPTGLEFDIHGHTLPNGRLILRQTGQTSNVAMGPHGKVTHKGGEGPWAQFALHAAPQQRFVLSVEEHTQDMIQMSQLRGGFVARAWYGPADQAPFQGVGHLVTMEVKRRLEAAEPVRACNGDFSDPCVGVKKALFVEVEVPNASNGLVALRSHGNHEKGWSLALDSASQQLHRSDSDAFVWRLLGEGGKPFEPAEPAAWYVKKMKAKAEKQPGNEAKQAAKAAKQAEKEAAKAEKQAVKEAAKAEKQAVKEAAKAEKEAAKEAAKAGKQAVKEAAKAEKQAAKEAAKAEKQAAKEAAKEAAKAVAPHKMKSTITVAGNRDGRDNGKGWHLAVHASADRDRFDDNGTFTLVTSEHGKASIFGVESGGWIPEGHVSLTLEGNLDGRSVCQGWSLFIGRADKAPHKRDAGSAYVLCSDSRNGKKAGLWAVEPHPADPSKCALRYAGNKDGRDHDGKGWFLAVHGSRKADRRDSVSQYVHLTADPEKASLWDLRPFWGEVPFAKDLSGNPKLGHHVAKKHAVPAVAHAISALFSSDPVNHSIALPTELEAGAAVNSLRVALQWVRSKTGLPVSMGPTSNEQALKGLRALRDLAEGSKHDCEHPLPKWLERALQLPADAPSRVDAMVNALAEPMLAAWSAEAPEFVLREEARLGAAKALADEASMAASENAKAAVAAKVVREADAKTVAIIDAAKPSRASANFRAASTAWAGHSIVEGPKGWVEYDLNVPEVCTVAIRAQYNAKQSRPLRLLLNGSEIATQFVDGVTGTWKDAEKLIWSEPSAPCELSAGGNTLRLEGDSFFPHLMRLDVHLVHAPSAELSEETSKPEVAAAVQIDTCKGNLAATTAAEIQEENPDAETEQLLAQLNNMGFGTPRANAHALTAAAGDLQIAVDLLLTTDYSALEGEAPPPYESPRD